MDDGTDAHRQRTLDAEVRRIRDGALSARQRTEALGRALAATRERTEGRVRYPTMFVPQPYLEWIPDRWMGDTFRTDERGVVHRSARAPFEDRRRWLRTTLFGYDGGAVALDHLAVLRGRVPPEWFRIVCAAFSVEGSAIPLARDVATAYLAALDVALYAPHDDPFTARRRIDGLFAALDDANGAVRGGWYHPRAKWVWAFLWETVTAVRTDRCAPPESPFAGKRYVPPALANALEHRGCDDDDAVGWVRAPDCAGPATERNEPWTVTTAGDGAEHPRFLRPKRVRRPEAAPGDEPPARRRARTPR